jgi:hypothetical protein
MIEDPTVKVRNETTKPQDIQVGHSVATILPGEEVLVYHDSSPYDDKMSTLLARGFRLV